MRPLNTLKSVDNSKHTIGIKCHVKSSQQKQTKKVVCIIVIFVVVIFVLVVLVLLVLVLVVFVMVVFVVVVFVLIVLVILTFSKYVDNSNNTKSQENSF